MQPISERVFNITDWHHTVYVAFNVAILYYKNCLNEKFRIVWNRSFWGRSIAGLVCWTTNTHTEENKTRSKCNMRDLKYTIKFYFCLFTCLLIYLNFYIFNIIFIVQLYWSIIDIIFIIYLKCTLWWCDAHRHCERISTVELIKISVTTRVYLCVCSCENRSSTLSANFNYTVQCYQL